MQIDIEENKKERKSHGNYGFPVMVNLESIETYENGIFMWHWHPEIELTLIVSGEIEYHVNSEVYILHTGDGIFGNSNTLHSGYKREGSNCSYISITFHPRFLYGYENSLLQTKYVDYITNNEQWGSLKLLESVCWQKEILDLIKKIYESMQEKSEDMEINVHIMLMQIWQKIYLHFRSLPKEQNQPHKYTQRVRDIISYIQEHYEQEIDLGDIARHVNICKSECCRFFKKYMGMTIFEYILYYRIQKSLVYLRRGESVTKASGLVGFSSPAYFGQIFKRYMNCTPKEYQKEHLNQHNE